MSPSEKRPEDDLNVTHYLSNYHGAWAMVSHPKTEHRECCDVAMEEAKKKRGADERG